MDERIFLIALVMLGASYIQSVTGFGFGIFAMIFLPHILAYTEANVLSSIVSVFISLLLVFSTWKKINWRNLVFPLLASTLTTFFAVEFIKTQDNDLLVMLLGIALVLLSVYFFFFSGKIKIKPTWYAGLIAGLFSGVLGGMFAMSGPPVVIYFLQSEEDSEHYLATISAYFVLSGIVSIATKVMAGFLTVNVWIGILVGVLCMAVGSFIGKKTRDKANPATINRVVYAVMALSGVANIINTLLF